MGTSKFQRGLIRSFTPHAIGECPVSCWGQQRPSRADTSAETRYFRTDRKQLLNHKYDKFRLSTPALLGFPCGSAGKESTCSVGDLGLIPGLGRSPGEGKGHPLQYCLASFVAQLIKNPPAMWEIWVRSPGEGKGYSLQYSGLEDSMDCVVQ